MITQVALTIKDNTYYPDSDAAFVFSEIAGTPHISAKTLCGIERLNGYEIVIRPVCRGYGHGGVVNNIIKMPLKTTRI